MARTLFFCVMVMILVSGLAVAAEEALILKVEKAISTETLYALGLIYLADLGDTYLVQGDQPALARLSEIGASFRTVTSIYPGEEIFLLRPKSFRDEMVYSEALFEVGRGRYIAKMETHEIDDLRFLPFSKVRLFPRPFPERSRASFVQPLAAVTPKPQIAGMVASVSGDTLWKYISQLSGREPVIINGALDTLLTRYSYSWRIDHAADYLRERFEEYGVDVSFHNYVVGKYSFYSTCFVDSLNGWVVGSDQRVYRTRDGGLSWTRQKPGALFQSFWGVCFIDTSKGWISGTSGNIYHTTDGGESWTQQSTPTSATLREICFLDSMNGWVVGYGGTILTTPDGGENWNSVSSGTSNDLYGLHFQSASRGWACGKNGTIRFWNGSSWSAQTSGSSEYLLDVHFADDNTGWIVGGGRTVLKTVDGGLNWVAQSAPPEADPYLKGVCFVNALEGWAVGLSGTVIHTSDGGTNWEMQSTGTLFGLRWVRFLNESEGWAVGYGCTILHTTDGGTTWESQRENLPSGALISLKNVVGTKPGTSSNEQVVICGHYDCTSETPKNLAPGADDNASGTAAVIEAARVVADYPFEKTIKFLCFSGEEQGLYGSGEYAAAAKDSGDSIVGVLNFDMIGYVDVAPEDVDVIGDWPSEWLVDFTIDCAAAYVPTLPTLKIIDETMVYSDHASFWKAGYDALLAIEDENVPYPYYHTTGDTLGNLTKSFATDVVKMGIATLAELAVPDTTASVAGQGEAPLIATAYPNPFSTATRVSFALKSKRMVKISIFDVEGRMVKILVEGSFPAGRHELAWRGEDEEGRQVSPGIYFTRIQTKDTDTSAKLILLR